MAHPHPVQKNPLSPRRSPEEPLPRRPKQHLRSVCQLGTMATARGYHQRQVWCTAQPNSPMPPGQLSVALTDVLVLVHESIPILVDVLQGFLGSKGKRSRMTLV